MGEYTIPGYISGRPFRFTIAGDTPSESEMARMQSILERDETEWQQNISQTTGLTVPYDEQPGTALGRGLARGVPQFQSALGTAAEYTGFEGVADYLQGAAQERQLDLLAQGPGAYGGADWRDVRGLSSGASYLGELIGEQLPLIGGTVAAGGAAFAAGVSAPVAAAIGTAGVSGPMLFGSNLQRQEQQVAAGELDEVSVRDAAVAAIGQTALEAASNVLLPGLGLTSGARGALAAIPVEALTEIGQQALERQQAGLPVDSEEAYREYLDAGIAGGAMGGAFGGAGLAVERIQAAQTARPRGEPSEPSAQPPAALSFDTETTGATLDALGLGASSGIRTALANDAPEIQILDRLTALAENQAANPDTAERAAQIRAYVAGRRAAISGAVQTQQESERIRRAAAELDQKITMPEDRMPSDMEGMVLAAEFAAAERAAKGETVPTQPTTPTPPKGDADTEHDLAVRDEANRTAADAARADAEIGLDIPFTEEELANQADVRRVAPGEVPFGEETTDLAPDSDQTPGAVEYDEEFVEGVRTATAKGLKVPQDIAELKSVRAAESAAATKTASTEEQPAARQTGAEIQGQATGAAGQVIPQGTPGWQGPPKPTMTQRVGQNRVMEAVPDAPMQRLVDRPANEAASAEMRAWQAENLSSDLYDFSQESQAKTPDGERVVTTEDVTTSRDKNRVLALLRSKFTKRTKEASNPEYAAFGYFRKAPSVTDAIDEIAYDAGAAPYKQFDPRGITNKGEREYFANTGITWGKSAVRWVRETLGPEANAYLDAQLEMYAEFKNAALQRNVTDLRVRQDTKAVKKNQKYVEAWQQQVDEYSSGTEAARASRRRQAREGAAETLHPTTAKAPWDPMVFGALAGMDEPMHPKVARAILAGDVQAAARALMSTTPSLRARRTIKAILPYLANTRIMLAQNDTINTVAGVESGLNFEGIYASVVPESELSMYDEARQDIYRIYGGTIMINADANMSSRTVMHEMLHAVTQQAAYNRSHPLHKQLRGLLAKAQEALPGQPEALNLAELIVEVFTNDEARTRLAQVPVAVNGRRVSLLSQIMGAIKNFLRTLVGSPRVDYSDGTSNVRDEFDALFDRLLSTDDGVMRSGELLSEVIQPRRIQDVFARIKSNIAVASPEAMADFQDQVRNGRVPSNVKDLFLRATVPFQYVSEYASKYFPSAARIEELVRGHNASRVKDTEHVQDTIALMSERLTDSTRVGAVSDLMFDMTTENMDVRNKANLEAFEKWSVSHTVMRSGSPEVITETFATRADRNARAQALKDSPPADMVGDVRYTNPDSDKAARFKELRKVWQGLSREEREAIDLAFQIPVYMRKRMQRALRNRLKAMSPESAERANRIYGEMFAKVFAGRLVDPYLSLQRSGDFGLAFDAADPTLNGKVEYYKVAFKTERERRQAIRYLQGLPEESKVRIHGPYDLRARDYQKVGVPTMVLDRIMREIDANQMLADQTLKTEIIKMVMESVPESSFLSFFKAREGIPGFEGDRTVLGGFDTAQDILNNIKTSGLKMANRVADMEFGQEMESAREQINREYQEFGQRPGIDPLQAAREQEDAAVYRQILMDYSRTPTQGSADWSRKSVSGAYFLTLGFNISTALLTFAAFPTIIMPYLAVQYSLKLVGPAMGVASRILHSTGGSRQVETIGPDGQLVEGSRKTAWYDFSLSNLDFSQTQNAFLEPLHRVGERLAEFNRSSILEELNAIGARGFMEKAAAYSGLLQHHMERYTRENTAIATYLMELYKRSGQEGRVSFKQFVSGMRDGSITMDADVMTEVARQTWRTTDRLNGVPLATDAPLWAQSDIGRVAYLYKRYGLSMIHLLLNTFMRGLKGASPETRRTALLQVGSILGSVALISGAQGLPMFHLVAALYNMLKDDDDEDLETVIRTGALGEVGLTGLANHLTGTNVSERIGLSGIFYRPGFNTEGQTPAGILLEGLGGPVVGLFNKYAGRVPELLSEGEYYRATEAAMPSAMGNMLRAFRYGTEGATTMRGDPIVAEFSPYEIGAQFFGFQPAEYGRQLAINSQLRNIDNALNRRITRLLARRNQAIRAGDRDGVREAMEGIREFNRRYPHAAISSETLDRSLSSFQRTTGRMRSGITFSDRNEAFLERLSREYG